MSSSKTETNSAKLLERLKIDNPGIEFVAGSTFYWSPIDKKVYYGKLESAQAAFSLLHELSHSLLKHKTYDNDISLLMLEAAAWEKAIKVAKKYDISIPDDHVQDCLDTYRDWLHKRSTCPNCKAHGIQKDNGNYSCLNCKSDWQVTSARFCRVYRKTAKK